MLTPFRVIVVEGALEVSAVLRILAALELADGVPQPIDKGGRGRFWADISRYNQAALQAPVLALADLENEPCPTALFNKYLPHGWNPNLVLRLAVRMLESWLLAHREGLAEFLKISQARIPSVPDSEDHAKRTVVNLARASRSRRIREDLVPAPGTSGVVGPNYTARMSEFIREYWRPLDAQARSPSLRRALKAIMKMVSP